MRKVDQELAPWNGAAAALYLLLAAGGYVLLLHNGSLPALFTLTALDVLLLSLAAFRVTHLLTYDKILNAVRDFFMDAHAGKLTKPAAGFRRLMCELLECVWCTSMWSGLFMLVLYFLGRAGRFAVVVLAIAGASALVQTFLHRIVASVD